MPEQRLDTAPSAPDSASESAGASPPCADNTASRNESQAGTQPEAPQVKPMPEISTQHETTTHQMPNWLRQLERVMRVLVRLYLGLLVCFAPWYPQAWDNNPLFSQPPSLLHFITQGYVRGLVSGLGLLNLWIALSDALSSSKNDTE